MKRSPFSITEVVILITVFLIISFGFSLYYLNKPSFDQFVKEDGFAEWVTVFGLIAGALVCFQRLFIYWNKKQKWFLLVTAVLGLFLFFAAGEEISWGQRIFHITTPDYFMEHNAQKETNLHNLVVGGVKLNKLIFSLVLVSVLVVFLVGVPWLYAKNEAARKVLDTSAIPVPRLYQVIGFAIMFGITSLIPDGKNAELLECGGALLFFLIVRFPKNKSIFSNQ